MVTVRFFVDGPFHFRPREIEILVELPPPPPVIYVKTWQGLSNVQRACKNDVTGKEKCVESGPPAAGKPTQAGKLGSAGNGMLLSDVGAVGVT
jgi:hypothetical protein